MAKKKNRAAIFARYSSHLQSDLSLEAQVTEMEAFCEREGLEITHRYLLPETRSALVERSDKFQEMVRAAKKGEFDNLIVHKLDRFTRDRDTAITYKSLLRRHGIQVRSVTENLGTSVHERMVEGFLEVIAEFYSLNLAAETKKGQRAAIRAGRWTGGKPPFGYQRGKDEKGHTVLERCPIEGPILENVFGMYADEHNVTEILDYTERATGKRWSYPTLQNRLKNPTYFGRLEYGKTSLDAKGKRTVNDPDDLTVGSCLALIDEETWNRVRLRMGESKRRNTQRNYSYLLSEGVMYCACCGKPAVGRASGMMGHPYYICSGWRDGVCTTKKKRSVRADQLEAEFIARVQELTPKIDLHNCHKAAKMLSNSRQEYAKSEETAILEELAGLKEQKDNLLDFILSGGAKSQSGTIAKKLQELENKENALGENLATVRMKIEQQTSDLTQTVQEWFLNMIKRLDHHHSKPEWKRAVQSLFRLEWDWASQSGEVYLAPVFTEADQRDFADLTRSTIDFRSSRI